MSSRPSNSRRRASNEIAVESTSRTGVSRPSASRSTEAFFYPPMTPMTPSSNQGTSQSLVPPTTNGLPPLTPHPYQSYAPESYDYHTSSPAIPEGASTHLQPSPHTTRSVRSPSASSVNVHPDGSKQLSVQQTYYVHHHHHHHHHHVPPSQNPLLPPQRRARVGRPLSQQIADSRLVRKYRRVIWVLLFLPIPPLLSVLYVVVGHSILRHTFSASSSPTNTDMGKHEHNPWSPSLVSSANAAAAGGVILAFPLFLALYIILPSPPHITPTRSRTPRDDFFEDDDEEAEGGLLARVAAYFACAVMLFGVGGAAAALGVTCMAGGSEKTKSGKEVGERERERGILTTGRAAEAGIVGAAVLLGAVLVLVALGVVGWWLWVSRGRREGEEEGKI